METCASYPCTQHTWLQGRPLRLCFPWPCSSWSRLSCTDLFLTLSCSHSLRAPAVPCVSQADVTCYYWCPCASHALCFAVGCRCDAAEPICRDGCCILSWLCCRRSFLWLPVMQHSAHPAADTWLQGSADV